MTRVNACEFTMRVTTDEIRRNEYMRLNWAGHWDDPMKVIRNTLSKTEHVVYDATWPNIAFHLDGAFDDS